MTPQQLEILRFQLRPLHEDMPDSAELRDFCRFYNIDFAAQQPQVIHRVGTLQSGAFTLAVHQWEQPQALANLLLVHGYYDHTGLFGKLIEWGLSQRYNVVIFDLPGHGLSSGEPAVIDDFRCYSQAIQDVLDVVPLSPLPLFAMGQSTGGAALIDFARHYRWPFAATVLLAPLVRPAGWLGVRLAQRLLGPFVDSVPRTFAVNTSDTDFLEFVKADPLQCLRVPLRWIAALRRWLADLEHVDLGVGPVLVVQGDADGTVGWRYNMGVLARMFPDSKVEYVAGAGHQLANESKEIRRRYLQLVEAYLASNGIAPNDFSGIEAR